MTDQELIELAAKAHGKIDYYKITLDGAFKKGGGIWSPLLDDGDALRLAVKLQLEIRPGLGSTSVSNVCYKDPLSFVWYDGDPYKATRRAIVMAAAKIAKINENGEGDD